jgi:hypothetical protein
MMKMNRGAFSTEQRFYISFTLRLPFYPYVAQRIAFSFFVAIEAEDLKIAFI